jgi:hypothetical protein
MRPTADGTWERVPDDEVPRHGDDGDDCSWEERS